MKTDGSPLAVVLAAGLGTRMKSRRPKVLHAVCGRPMIAYALDAAAGADCGATVVVLSPATREVGEAVVGSAGIAIQDEPRGTADALRAALESTACPEGAGLELDTGTVGSQALDSRAARSEATGAGEVVVLSGDTPLLRAETVREVAEHRRASGAAVALATIRPRDAHGYGRIVRNTDGHVERIVEEKDALPEERAIGEVNAGLYAFDGTWLRSRIGDVAPSGATGELYLTALVALAREDGRDVVAVEVADEWELAGINDRIQLSEVEAELRRRIVERHMRDGVTMLDPRSVIVDATVEMAADVVLEPSVMLQGQTRIGAETTIGAGSRIVDSTIGERCRIVASVIEASEIGDDVSVGPFAHVRRGSTVGDHADERAGLPPRTPAADVPARPQTPGRRPQPAAEVEPTPD